MAIKTITVMTIVLQMLCYKMVEGIHRKLSIEEDLEIEKQLARLNKPSIMSIKTKYGDLYDCVDFFKQPAFDDPLLRNHTYHFKMRPSFANKNITKKQSNISKHDFGLGDGCPIGTVPIRRTTKDDLIRAKAFTNDNVLKRAVLQTTQVGGQYHGAGGVLSVFQPNVTQTQYSSSQITLSNGPETIQVGWTANPGLYGDERLRLFTFFRGSRNSCYNTRCPGFIIVNTRVPLDELINPLSTRGGALFIIFLFVEQDDKVGNWWLLQGPDYEEIGFWPARIFNRLNKSATYVDWGGEVSCAENEFPQMGSGFKLDRIIRDNAYIRTMKTLDQNYEVTNADKGTKTSTNVRYNIDDWGVFTGRESYIGHIIMFGGPN